MPSPSLTKTLVLCLAFVVGLQLTAVLQGVAVGDRTHLGIYASKFYGVSQT